MSRKELIDEFLSRAYSNKIEICRAYDIDGRTFHKYVVLSKVKIKQVGKRCFYKTDDVHKMLSELGYPRLKRPCTTNTQPTLKNN